MPTPTNILPANTPLVTEKGLLTGPWYRYFTGQNRTANAAIAGEVLTPAGSGLEGGGVVADGVSLSIAPNGVSNAMLRQSNGYSVIGRYGPGTGDVGDIIATSDNRVLARIGGMLAFFPLSAVPATVADGDYGDITVSGTGTVWTIDAGVVTYGKMQNVSAASRLLGRGDSGAGSPQEISLGAGLSVTGTTLATTASALSKVDDTNVTLTLGGAPATALLAATSLTLGWSGTLAVARGGTGGGSASGTLLDNITGFSSTGMMARTGAGAYSFRTITAGAGITVTNGDGVSGNPTVALEAAWSTWSPTYSAGSGSFTTTTTNAARYRRYGNLVFILLDVTITNAGTAAGSFLFTLPINASVLASFSGKEIVTTGFTLAAGISSATQATVREYDNTTCIATNARLLISGFYEAA